MVVQEFCVKKVARSQKAGQQWSIWKYCSWCKVLQDLCVKKKVTRSQKAGQQWSTESWSPGAPTEKQWDDELKLLAVDAAIFHRTGSAKVVADFPRWWNCNIFMWRHTRGSISNLLHDYYKECCAAVIKFMVLQSVLPPICHLIKMFDLICPFSIFIVLWSSSDSP